MFSRDSRCLDERKSRCVITQRVALSLPLKFVLGEEHGGLPRSHPRGQPPGPCAHHSSCQPLGLTLWTLVQLADGAPNMKAMDTSVLKRISDGLPGTPCTLPNHLPTKSSSFCIPLPVLLLNCAKPPGVGGGERQGLLTQI